MDFNAEDMGRVAMMRVDEKGVTFKGITPMKVGSLEIAVVGKAKVVAVKNASRDELLAILQDSEQNTAIKDAWVLVMHDSEYDEAFMKRVHSYVTIVNELESERVRELEECSRGWNVENEAGEHVNKRCIVIGKDAEAVEVLFGESRENPIGLLSVKCMKE